MSGRGIKRKAIFSKSQKAGLVFPVARFHRYLKNQFSISGRFRISVGAAVYVASVLEYLVAEVNEQAGNAAKVQKRKRITPRHIMWAIFQDSEMNQLLKHVILPSTGRPVIPLAGNVTGTTKTIAKPSSVNKSLKPEKLEIKKSERKLSQNVKYSKPAKKSKVSKRKKNIGNSIDEAAEVLNERTLFLGQKLTVIQGDIINVTADAVVHPTSSNYGFGGQVGQALSRKGGNDLDNEVNKLRAVQSSIKLCEAAVSGAVNIPYKHIIHVHSPSWTNDVNTAISNLQKAITNILDLADKHHIHSLAMPSISSGGNGYPKQIAAETILKVINAYFAGVTSSCIKQIYFVIYDKETLDVYKAELTRLA